MVYLRTVFALIACKEASLFGVDSCSCTSASTFYKLREIERKHLCAAPPAALSPAPPSLAPAAIVAPPARCARRSAAQSGLDRPPRMGEGSGVGGGPGAEASGRASVEGWG